MECCKIFWFIFVFIETQVIGRRIAWAISKARLINLDKQFSETLVN